MMPRARVLGTAIALASLAVGGATITLHAPRVAVAQTGKALRIPGTTSGWLHSDLCFEKGSHVEIQVSGSIKHSSWDGNYHGPEGNPSSFCGSDCKPFSNSCNVAALVFKLGGGGQVHCTGSVFVADVANDTGELLFGINDTPVGDNEGAFDVVISGGSLCASRPPPQTI